MATMSFEQLEQHVIQLKPQEQLRLVARISQRLSAIFQPSPKPISPMQEREEEVKRLLSLCDEAAEMWEGSFNAVEDMQQATKNERADLVAWARRQMAQHTVKSGPISQDDDKFLGNMTTSAYFALPDAERERIWAEMYSTN